MGEKEGGRNSFSLRGVVSGSQPCLGDGPTPRRYRQHKMPLVSYNIFLRGHEFRKWNGEIGLDSEGGRKNGGDCDKIH